jgi:hypothetical protein
MRQLLLDALAWQDQTVIRVTLAASQRQLQQGKEYEEALRRRLRQLQGLPTQRCGHHVAGGATAASCSIATAVEAGMTQCQSTAAASAGMISLQKDDNILRLAAMQLAVVAHQLRSGSGSGSNSSNSSNSSSNFSRGSQQNNSLQQQQQQQQWCSIPAYHMQLLTAAGLDAVTGMLQHPVMSRLTGTQYTPTHSRVKTILGCLQELPNMHFSCSSSATNSSRAVSEALPQQLLTPLLLTCAEIAALAHEDADTVRVVVSFIRDGCEAVLAATTGSALTTQVLQQLSQPVLLLLGPAVLACSAAAATARSAPANSGHQQIVSLSQQHRQAMSASSCTLPDMYSSILSGCTNTGECTTAAMSLL